MWENRREFNKTFGQTPPEGRDNPRNEEKGRSGKWTLNIVLEDQGENGSSEFRWGEPHGISPNNM